MEADGDLNQECRIPLLCFSLTCAMKSFWLRTAWWNLFTSSAWNCFRTRLEPFTCRDPFPALLSEAPCVSPLVWITPLCSAIKEKTPNNSLLQCAGRGGSTSAEVKAALAIKTVCNQGKLACEAEQRMRGEAIYKHILTGPLGCSQLCRLVQC